jgi:hypothetical protein
MSAVISTEFQHRRAAQMAAENIGHLSHEAGFRQGYAVGKHDTVPHIQRALGVGVLVGVCIGIVMAFVAVGVVA